MIKKTCPLLCGSLEKMIRVLENKEVLSLVRIWIGDIRLVFKH